MNFTRPSSKLGVILLNFHTVRYFFCCPCSTHGSSRKESSALTYKQLEDLYSHKQLCKYILSLKRDIKSSYLSRSGSMAGRAKVKQWLTWFLFIMSCKDIFVQAKCLHHTGKTENCKCCCRRNAHISHRFLLTPKKVDCAPKSSVNNLLQ